MPNDYPSVTGSDHWIQKFRTIFRCYDINADGYLTEEDFMLSTERATEYLGLDDRKAKHLLHQRLTFWEIIPKSPEDPSKVTEKDFLRNISSVVNEDSFRQKYLLNILTVDFKTMDLDGDGFASEDQFAAFFYSLNVPIDKSREMFGMLDDDKDGFISMDEFAHVFMEYFFTEDPENAYNELYGPLAEEVMLLTAKNKGKC
ncbi:uncharacterized protein LOC106173684 [Lingula anatina]|uniref:Uncharacterized protein LOC106173684 n=1 Tax=Lingula anatina TaxID=7574 RepID=A0A1S3JKA2_LINAN|nr:uncharacterized protein LOC106173684 [Lingula anatina]|eukprot:XP_013410339.1 uncharacterized protein LOC106173684 [Lingula anatina]